ncbi:short-chain dehydrogenases/reductase [Sanghuangporus baumii]|uniref:Short-chain dehydrogenases/reductase n=1 Tax=Sanghuangporus baumii TaxID=108892 RepID=A0A9Q5HU51_SANBA|nr:short-chain dehydrogenases/reductase [Sanghuangporus baumii]
MTLLYWWSTLLALGTYEEILTKTQIQYYSMPKECIITVGASRNLGLGFVRYLSSDWKNKVFALVRNKTTATQFQEFADSDVNKYKNVIVIEADLSDYKSIKAAATAVSEATGGEFDVLINNGVLLHQERNWMTIDGFPDEETLEKKILTFFKTNAIGATHIINAFIPLLCACFALVTDQSACPAYSISKAALNMVIAKFATKFKDDGFTILAVSPGLIKPCPGLGFVQALSSDPENIVFASVRNKSTTTQLRDFVNSEANKHKNVVVLEADLNDYKSLKTAAKEVSKATQGELDVLINNGALFYHERGRLTMDSYPDEETLENDLLSFGVPSSRPTLSGQHMRSTLSFPLLRAGKTKKVLVVSSSMGSPSFALATNASTAGPYAISKAALNMVVAKFAIKLKDEGFTIIAVSPGLVRTKPGRKFLYITTLFEFGMLPLNADSYLLQFEASDQVDKIYESIVTQKRQVNPTYLGAISVEQTVKDQLSLLKRMTPTDTGAFVHANGEDANDPTY